MFVIRLSNFLKQAFIVCQWEKPKNYCIPQRGCKRVKGYTTPPPQTPHLSAVATGKSHCRCRWCAMICGIKINFFLITNRSKNLDVALFLLFVYIFTFLSIDIFTTQYINKMYDHFNPITLLTFFPLLLLSAFSCPVIPSPALLLPVFQQPQLRGGCVMTMSYP